MIGMRAIDNGFEAWVGRDILRVECVGAGLRVRAGGQGQICDNPFSALDEAARPGDNRITVDDRSAAIEVGLIRCEASVITSHGDPKHEIRLQFVDRRTGRVLLRETRAHFAGPGARAFHRTGSDSWRAEACFEGCEGERIVGMGQRQHGLLSQEGCVLELAHRNGEVSIPFAISSRGYGFLWNCPATGRAEFGRSLVRWTADTADYLDYWITAGSPAEILSAFREITGAAPEFPDWALGLWQSRLRYTSQAEVLEVAEGYAQRDLPLSAIVVDFFHWTRQGEWRFDPRHWPDPAAMVSTLAEQGVRTVVSIWPTVHPAAASADRMAQHGWLLETAEGDLYSRSFIDVSADGSETTRVHFYDATKAEAAAHVMDLVSEGYVRHGITSFWLDACEPELLPFRPEQVRIGGLPATACLGAYPARHIAAFHAAMQAAGEESPVLLCRSAWIGSHRHGCLLWSGDIPSTFDAMRAQLPAGLNAGLSGIGWWTTDTGGFYDGRIDCPGFRELLLRWFQWSVFTPVLRLHGFRVAAEAAEQDGHEFAIAGAENELWSYGPEIYDLLCRQLRVRLALKPYLKSLFSEYAASGIPPMRPMFLAFPGESAMWDLADQYMFGSQLLVAPILAQGEASRSVLFPQGTSWECLWTGQRIDGGARLTVAAPIDRIPVFVRRDGDQPDRGLDVAALRSALAQGGARLNG
jgi:alpha-D-xyloside xylohydrolase